MRLGKRRDGVAARVAQFVGPVAPVAFARAGQLIGLQRLEARVVFERASAAFDERRKVLREGRFRVLREPAEKLAEYGELRLRRARPVDQREVFQLRHVLRHARALDRRACGRRAEHGGRIDVRDVQKEARRRRVRAEFVRLRAEHRVHRADRERVAAAFRALDGKRRERREIADAAVARTAQPVDLRRYPPERRRIVGRVVVQRAPGVVDGVAARRRDGERRVMVVDDERVVARLRDRREQCDLALRRSEPPVDHGATFQFDPVARARPGRRHRQRDRAVHFGGDERRQLAAGQFRVERGHAVPQLRGVAARQAEAFEQYTQRRLGHALGVLVRVEPFDFEARARGERFDRAHRRRRFDGGRAHEARPSVVVCSKRRASWAIA
ncbi:hypothetical protein AWB81_02418 [Caballeronia arationis]|nr:hypothetical protein AWB81_02418 [Caballeronia arationis]